MRALATPAALLIAPPLFPLAGEFKRPAYDPNKAKALLAEAGVLDEAEHELASARAANPESADVKRAQAGLTALRRRR